MFIIILQMDLTQNLLTGQVLDREKKRKRKRKNSYINTRLSMIYEKFVNQPHNQQKIVRSKISNSVVSNDWSEEQIVHRNLILQEPIQQSIQPLQRKQQNLFRSSNYSNIFVHSIYQERKEQNSTFTNYKDLNNRIFSLTSKIQKFLYYFNLILNTFYRMGLLTILVFLFIQQKSHQFAYALLGLYLSTIFLYTTAIIKIVFTKSGLISVYFQKTFYEKPYADIQMDRILRKHFSLHRIVKNFWTFLNPYSSYNKDLKISILKQQFFKRIETILVFIPFVLTFAFQINWFQFPQFPQTSSQTFIAAVVLLELTRLCMHYLIIYVTS